MGQAAGGLEADVVERLLEAYAQTGSIRKASAAVGIPKSTAARYLKETPKSAAPVVAQQRVIVERSGASLWDARGALDENYARLLRLVDDLEGRIDSANPMPAMLYLSTLKEIREHVKAGMAVAKLLIDINEVRAFQDSVLEAITEADPATRERIVRKLEQKRAMGLAVGAGRVGRT
jgi:molybdenum-dependent DNA-binding transcriptional regulator ModE